MKRTVLFALLCSILAGCPAKEATKEKDDESEEDEPKKKKKKKDKEKKDEPTAKATSTATATATATAIATASAVPTADPTASDESFFAGPIPSGVKVKAIKANAIENGALVFQPVEGWNGGGLPGRDYMAMSKDQSAVFRVDTSSAVVREIACKNLERVIAMAPVKGKNIEQVSPGKLVKVGANGFVAKEGTCSAENDKGKLEVHYIDILKGSGDDEWHYAVVVSFPKDAPKETKDEAQAWARSLEFNGKNGYKL